MTPWSAADDRKLRREYPDHTAAEMTRRLGRTLKAVYRRAHLLGLSKSPAFLASDKSGRMQVLDTRGAACRFKPGAESWNKGKSYAAGGRSAETRFRPGVRPHTTVPVGTITLTDDGYLKQKIRDDAAPGMSRRNWKFVHTLVWEAAHGPVPAGHAVVFIDGDRKNVALENLALLSRQQLMKKNWIYNYPEELVQVMQLKGALVRKINRRTRNEEQT